MMHTASEGLEARTVFIFSILHFISNKALPGALENRGNRAFISGEQGNKGQILRGTGEQRQYLGTGKIRIFFLIFGEQGNKPIYFRGTREQVPSLGGPQQLKLHAQLS